MSAASTYVALKKIKGLSILLAAARHNLRERPDKVVPENSHHTPPCPNRVLAGHESAHEIVGQAKTLIAQAGLPRRLRCDAVTAIEVLISLPTQTQVDTDAFFDEALAWVRETFDVPVLSAIIHFDEAAPHCHFLLLPLVNDRMVGSRLMGHSPRLAALHQSFHATVGSHHGLRAPQPRKRLSSRQRMNAAARILCVLQEDPALLKAPSAALESAFHALCSGNPEAMLALLRISPASLEALSPKSSFVQIMTRPCSPEKPDRPRPRLRSARSAGSSLRPDSKRMPTPTNDQSLSCVGFSPDKAGVLWTRSAWTLRSETGGIHYQRAGHPRPGLMKARPAGFGPAITKENQA